MHKGNSWQLLTIALTCFVVILVPVYWYSYGAQNFLWLSDIGLFLTVFGLWARSRLLISMAAIGVLFVEVAWNIDFFSTLLLNLNLLNLSSYMFDASYPLMLRALSLFHIFMPVVWMLYLKEYGYDKRALYSFTLVYWIMLPLVYFFTDHRANINWVFLPEVYPFHWISPEVWVILLSVLFPLVVFLPSHYIYKKIFKVV